MANTYKNKILFNGNILIDLTTDDVQASDVAAGVYFHLPTGERTVGTGSGGVDGDNLEYGTAHALVGTAVVGTAIIA